MKKLINTTAKDVVTISGSIWNDTTRTVANAVNYNAQILKDALNRIVELEKTIKSKAESEESEKINVDENFQEFKKRVMHPLTQSILESEEEK